jgi:ribosome-associated protein
MLPADPSQSLPIAPGLTLPDSAIHFTFSRSGGPGGQNVNKLNTRATLTIHLDDLAQYLPLWALNRLKTLAGDRFAHDPDRLVITSADSRSQLANRRACLLKLRDLIIHARNRPRPRKPTRPTRGSVERRLETKKQHSQLKKTRQQRPKTTD